MAKTKSKKRISDKKRYIINSLIFLAIMAFFLTWFLEYRYYMHSAWHAWDFIFKNPAPYLFNSLLMFLMLTFIWGIVEKPGTSAGFVWVIIIAITYAHINKFKSRGFPLSPEDFQLASEASSLSKFVSVESIIHVGLAIAIVIFLTVLFNVKLAKKLHLTYTNPSPSFVKRHIFATRLIIIALSGLSFFFATDFVRHNDGSRYEDTFLGTHFTAWNQNRNYNDNGFILGFLYNLQKLQLAEPDQYSEAKMMDLKDQYTHIAKEKNKDRINPSKEDVSVVMILNESFFDPSIEFQGLKFEDYYPHSGGDITPNLHRLMREYPSGHMYSLDYGGGTANIEFEADTSLTNYWINTVPYTALIPKAGEIPSIAQTFKKYGYETSAIHPYNGGMYKRNIALANEGFDDFTDVLEMKHQEKEGESEYVNDKSAYAETIDKLKSTKNKQVISLITMQNHTPYNKEYYETTDFAIDESVDSDRKDDIEIYYQSLHTSDQYLGEFIEDLKQLDKKVVVLFYGDHSAGLFDITNGHESKMVRDLSRITPYFIFANYDAHFNNYTLPTTTPNCMVNTMYNILNWKKDPLYYLVDEVCSVEPILTSTYLEERSISSSELLRDYELLTYDILGGEKYWMQK